MKCDVCDSDKGDSMATCTSCNEAMIDDVRARAFKLGMVVGVAIVAMFEAIRANAPRIVRRSYWTSEIDGAKLYDCSCPGCGVRMKGREAGVHEGTDLEWCGVCRDSR